MQAFKEVDAYCNPIEPDDVLRAVLYLEKCEAWDIFLLTHPDPNAFDLCHYWNWYWLDAIQTE